MITGLSQNFTPPFIWCTEPYIYWQNGNKSRNSCAITAVCKQKAKVIIWWIQWVLVIDQNVILRRTIDYCLILIAENWHFLKVRKLHVEVWGCWDCSDNGWRLTTSQYVNLRIKLLNFFPVSGSQKTKKAVANWYLVVFQQGVRSFVCSMSGWFKKWPRLM